MISVLPFKRCHTEQIVALWRSLHPGWTWLDDLEQRDKVFAPGDERIGYVVQRGDAVIASVFGTCSREKNWPRNRFIHIEARPADIAAEWLDPVLASLLDADRGQPDTWHVVNPTEILLPVLAPLLQTAGFFPHSSTVQMEWSGESVAAVDPSPAHLERYAGGNREIDRAIVDLHNRSYRAARLVPPTDLESLWQPWPRQQMREFVLALEGDRLVGYAEWSVTDDKPCINNLVIARSHWGRAVVTAVGIKAVQILLDLGYRKIRGLVLSNNAAAIRLNMKFGWRIASEVARTFVRKL